MPLGNPAARSAVRQGPHAPAARQAGTGQGRAGQAARSAACQGPDSPAARQAQGRASSIMTTLGGGAGSSRKAGRQ